MNSDSTFISGKYTSLSKHFEYGYPHSNALLCRFSVKILFHLKSECCKAQKATCHPTNCGANNDIKLLLTVNCRINCPKFLTVSNQMARYISMCVKMDDLMGLLG